MNIDEQVSIEIYNEIFIELLGDYEKRLKNGCFPKYQLIHEFYTKLSSEEQEKFMLFLDSLARNIVSIILGGFDGSTKLGKFFGGFTINYEGQEITPYLQDNFLGIYEDNFNKKSRVIIPK